MQIWVFDENTCELMEVKVGGSAEESLKYFLAKPEVQRVVLGHWQERLYFYGINGECVGFIEEGFEILSQWVSAFN